MERKIVVTGMQKLTSKKENVNPMYKIHYTYEDKKINGLGADSVLVSEGFVNLYSPKVNGEYLAAVYYDNAYRTHFAALFVEG